MNGQAMATRPVYQADCEAGPSPYGAPLPSPAMNGRAGKTFTASVIHSTITRMA
jgi:hypothetical protein